jgi:hypothetical protein
VSQLGNGIGLLSRLSWVQIPPGSLSSPLFPPVRTGSFPARRNVA